MLTSDLTGHPVNWVPSLEKQEKGWGIGEAERFPFTRVHVAKYCTVWNDRQVYVLLLLLFLKLAQMSKEKTFQETKAQLHELQFLAGRAR